jgi:tetratricopeptide (TPR) repeat protein
MRNEAAKFGGKAMKIREAVTFLIFVLAVLIIADNCATTTQSVNEHPLVVQREIGFQHAKSSLYWSACEWMGKTLVDSDGGIQYQNEEEGIIVGQGVSRQQSRYGNVYDVTYDFLYVLTVEVIDNHARTTIEAQYGKGEIQDNIMIITEPHLIPRNDYEDLKEKFNSIIENLASYMKKGSIALEYNEIGIAKAKNEDYEGSIRDFTRAIEIIPYFPGSYDNRGIAKRYIGDYEGAIADHTRAIELNPDHYGAYNNRANAKLEMGNYKGAIADLTKAAELNFNHFGLYYNRAYAKERTGDYEGAIADLTRAIELNPDFPDAYNNRGWIYIKQEKYLDSITDLNKALSIDKTSSSYDTRGWAFFFLDRFEEAYQDAVAALEIDSECFNSRALLYRIEIQKGNKEEAVASLKRYMLKYQGEDLNDNYFLVLKYLSNEVTLDYLKKCRDWEDLKVALINYQMSND